MTNQDSLVKTLELIEQWACEKITVQALSREAYISGSHLQRLFSLLTGQSLMDYARGRKLAHSLYELLNTDFRIIDIAEKYGFQHEQSYIRAFRREFGCPPGEARESGSILRVRERIAPNMLQTVGQGVLYGPELVMISSLFVVGIPHLFERFDSKTQAYEPNRIALEFCRNNVWSIPNKVRDDVYIGVSSRIPGPPHTIEYMPGVQVRDLDHIPTGMRGMTIPAHLCQCFRYVGEHHYEHINMVTAQSLYAAKAAYFQSQTRYVPSDMFIERIDASLYDGTYCRMDVMTLVTDTIQ